MAMAMAMEIELGTYDKAGLACMYQDGQVQEIWATDGYLGGIGCRHRYRDSY